MQVNLYYTIKPIEQSHTMKSIFDYNNHLEFLKDRYVFLKNKHSNFSQRYIASKLGFSSSANFRHILNKKITISDSLLNKIVIIFKLTKREADYFKILTHLNQSKSQIDKIHNLNKLIKFINVHLKKTKTSKYVCLKEKYKPLLLKNSCYINCNKDCKNLSFFLNKYIKGSKCRKDSFAPLKKYNIIECDNKGKIKPVNQIIINGAYKEIKELNNYYLNSLEVVRNLLYTESLDGNEFSSLIFSISEKTFNIIQKEIIELYKKILFLAEQEANPDNIYVLNLFSYPVLELISQRSNKKQGDTGSPIKYK